MKFLDANVILRYLTQDDAAKARRCEDLFHRTTSGKEPLYVTSLIIAEVVWVLEKAYKLPKASVADLIQKILNTPHIECDERDILMAAAGLYQLKNIDFIDVYNAIVMESKNITAIYSYDTHFDILPPLRRIEP